MSCFLTSLDQETNTDLNIDELYEKKQQRDLKQLSVFNKILNRIHKRIQFTSKNKFVDKHIWFAVPEYIFGEPLYNKGDCIGYIVSRLNKNGFYVKYVHPNTLFISWHNWVPSYVRNEFKKKTGIVIDEHGNIINTKSDEEEEENKAEESKSKTKDSKYTPIGQYKPTGNLVYNPEIFEKIEKRVS
jgi:hypothetical protein